MSLNIAEIKIHKIGTYRITFYAKGNISVDVIGNSLKEAYRNFFKLANQRKYNLTKLNTVFGIEWER